jgi:hypothetical protein
VLTREEKRVIVFILAAFVLGLGTKCYRDKHPQPPVTIDPKHPSRKQQSVAPSPSAKPKQKRARKPRSPKPKPTASVDAQSHDSG